MKTRSPAPAARGRFITLEGGEGAGKSTQIAQLAEYLRTKGIEVLVTREPGGTEGAEHIRELLLNGAKYHWDTPTELLLFMAARLDHVHQKIMPALNRGAWVISDRFQDSTTIYQGAGRGLGEAYCEQLYRQVLGSFVPDCTVILDIPVEVGLGRARKAHGTLADDRFENEAVAFHTTLREGFQRLATREPARCVLIDASGTVDEVQQKLRAVITARLGV